jgi:hypothetical protein
MNNDNTEEQDFNNLCLRLLENDPRSEDICICWDRHANVPFDDVHCLQFAQALHGNTNLVALNIGPFEPTDAFMFTQLGSDALAEGFKSCQLQRIYFCGENFENTIQPLLFASIQHSPTIQVVQFFEFNLDLPALSTVLRPGSILVNLDISYCRLIENDVMKLFEMLFNNCQCIQTFCLCANPLSDNAILSFIELWRPESPLTHLRLTKNQISPRGAQMLMRATAEHPSLKSLDLYRNESIGYEGLRLIGHELGNCGLVNLSICHMTPFCRRDLLHHHLLCTCSGCAAKELACRALAEGLSVNTTIQDINWAGNDLGSEGMRMMLHATASRSVSLNQDLYIKSVAELKAFGEALGVARLEKIKLCGYIDDEHPCDPNELYSDPAFKAVVTGLGENRTLSDFILGPRFLDSRDEYFTVGAKVAAQARAALLSVVKNNNYHLQNLELRNLELGPEIEFYLDLNRCGRLQFSRGEENLGLAPALWGHFLGKISTKASNMYYLLREQPWYGHQW